MQLPGPLVSVTWLAENQFDPNLIVLDASIKPVGNNSSNKSKVKIPRARTFDFDKKICDQKSILPHMMPPADLFEREVCELGINSDSCIVVYDSVGVFSSPRARWMFKAMGHDNVAVLDGGLPAWISEGHPTEECVSQEINLGNFITKPREHLFCDMDFVALALNNSSQVVLDARSAGRFSGNEPEPRPGLRSGHMPNALNIPFNDVLVDGKLRSVDELSKIFSSRIKFDQELIATCGSGVTACVIAFAAELIGYKDITIYDGSWSEWGLPSSRPVVTK
ncbi:sulfurtransferase [Bdellovibrio sp. qaytius]|nr:sulfurtransferase [Bdellovibrio sp. qaytius]